MISPKKLITYTEPKLLPTINITDQLSLNTWLDLRKLAVDYGRKFFYRHEIFLPVVFCIGLVSLVGAFILLIVDFKTSNHVWMELSKMKYLLLLNVWIMNFIFFGLLYQGAGINVEFSEHSMIMKKNKQLYNDLLFFQEFYFHPHIRTMLEDGTAPTQNPDDWILDKSPVLTKKDPEKLERGLIYDFAQLQKK
jgi:hypothetical protein